MPLMEQPAGDFRFLPGIGAYSCGAVSNPGFEIIHVTFQQPVAYRSALARIGAVLASHQRPKAALCGIELRSPRPYSFSGFAEFNAEYAKVLEAWDLFVNGINPVARTNVAPVLNPPGEPALYGFSFTKPCAPDLRPTFVVAGAGELPEGKLSREAIIALGDTSPHGLLVKSRFVMDLMESRLRSLGAEWSGVTTVNAYTAHSLTPLLPTVILGPMGAAGVHGVHWHYCRPPVEGIEYEMDMRGARTELYGI